MSPIASVSLENANLLPTPSFTSPDHCLPLFEVFHLELLLFSTLKCPPFLFFPLFFHLIFDVHCAHHPVKISHVTIIKSITSSHN